jgi:hypothetical protein
MEPAAFDSLILEPHDIKDGKLRKIYYGVQYEQYELEWIEKIKKEIEWKSVHFPEWIDDALLLKAMEANKGKASKAVTHLQEYITWCTTEMPVPVEEVEEHLPKNLCYSFGTDFKMRPVIVVNVSRVVALKLAP